MLKELKNYLSTILRRRMTRETAIQKAKEKFPEATEYEVEKAYEELFLDEDTEQLKRELEFYKGQYQKFRKRTDMVSEIVSLVKDNIIPFNAPKQIWKPSIKTNYSEEKAIFTNSDAHIGFNVDTLEAISKNTQYNADIAEKRIKYYTEKFLELTEERRITRSMNECYALYLGDLNEGNLKDINLSKDNVVQQVMVAGNIYANQILALSQNFKKVYVKAIPGNHSMIEKGYPDYNNYEYMMWQLIQEKCKNLVNVEFQLATQLYEVFNVYNWGICFTHGHIIRAHTLTPLYAIKRAFPEIKAVTEQVGKTFQYLFLGHFHNPNQLSVSGGKIFMCGSVCGFTPYALKAMTSDKYCSPEQFFCSISEKHGIGAWRCSIDLSGIY